eukprot:ANDGO_01861.mRNA.1 hypothetical protein
MESSSHKRLTQDILHHLVNRTQYQDLGSPERTIRKYLKIYYDIIIDFLNDKAEEMQGSQQPGFQRVNPSESQVRYSIIPPQLTQFIDWPELEELVSVFGTDGRPTVLTPEEEDVVYTYVATRAYLNMPITQNEFVEEVSRYLSKAGRERTITASRQRACSSGKGVPDKRVVRQLSQTWMKNFNERLEKRGCRPLVLRCPSTIERSREYSFNKSSVDEFFVLLKAAYERAGIRSQADAWRVVNIDETGVQGDQESKIRVLAPRGTPRVQLKVNPQRNHVTMVNAISADGKAYTPMFVYAGTGPSEDFLRHTLCGKGYNRTGLSRTDNG